MTPKRLTLPNSIWQFALLLLFLMISCTDELRQELDQLEAELAQIEEQNRILAFNNKLLAFKNRLGQANIAEELIADIENDRLLWENGAQYSFPDSLILDYTVHSEAWQVEFLMADSSEVTAGFQSNFLNLAQAEVKRDPFGAAPLTATIQFQTPVKGRFRLIVKGQDGPESDFYMPVSSNLKQHTLEVMGLYPGYQNEVEVVFLNDNGEERLREQLVISTEFLPLGLPEFTVIKADTAPQPNNLMLVNYRPTNIPFMVDPWGKIRWYSTGFSTQKKFGLQRMRNGNLMYGVSGSGQGKIVEYTLMGELIRQLDVYPEYENIHHDVYEMENGNLLVTVDKTGEETIEDHIIELDRQSGLVLTEWDLREMLPTDRFDYLLIKNGQDWFHCNAVIEDPSDHSIIVSGRAQGVVKVGWDKALKWILAPHVGWADPYDAHLLNPILNGDFDWAWGQHAPELLPNGNLLLFDNGYGRDFGNALADYSRAVEYEIEEAADHIGGNIKQVWEYGKERGDEMYASFISDVDYISSRDSRLIIAGSIGFEHQYLNYDSSIWTPLIDTPETRIIEVNNAGEVLYELLFHNDTHAGSTYRAEKLFFQY